MAEHKFKDPLQLTKDDENEKNPNNKIDELLNEHKQTEEWDQFKLNKEKYNVESTFTDIKYTTSIDLNSIPDEIKKEAELIEQVFIILII